ncbi:hypothetical protein ACFSZS_18230 [Seohaeicola zhoushanensis]
MRSRCAISASSPKCASTCPRTRARPAASKRSPACSKRNTTDSGLKLDGMAIEVVNWLVTASGRQPDRSASRSEGGQGGRGEETRPVYIRGVAQDVAVWQRNAITDRDRIMGPVIIEERETTIFVLEGWVVTKHESGSLVAEKTGEK